MADIVTLPNPPVEPAPQLNVLAIIRVALIDTLAIDDIEKFPVTTELISGLGMDSLDMVNLAIKLEESFSITVPTEDFDRMVTIGDVEKYVRNSLLQKKDKLS